MITCAIKNSREYQTLKDKSGLSDFELQSLVDGFTDYVGRFPNLDELQGANSESYIKNTFKLRKDNVTKTSKILEETNTNSIQEAVKVINDQYRDKEVEILELGEQSKMFITPRPTITPDNIGNDFDGENVNSMSYWNTIVQKLQDLYGINIISITNAELAKPEWKEIVGVDLTKSFIYNGDIYINTDIATLDSPIHELLHILFGSMKFQNRELYEQLVSQATKFSSYQDITQSYPNRTQNDLNEEVFITELAKHLVGYQSDIDDLPDNIKYEIGYNINRMLDTILMGDASVNCIPKTQLYGLSLKNIAKMVNSASMNTDYSGYFNDATLNRMLANTKQQLMSDGLLQEECE